MFDYAERELLITERLNEFEPVSLKGLDEVKLLNRMDSKFIFHIDDFPSILDELKPHYRVLEIDSKRMFSYESVYFDTNDLLLYKFHHNGKLNRLKVRYRKYLDSGLTFFEVKYKVKGVRTDKHRIKQADIKQQLTETELALVHHDYANVKDLHQKLTIWFKRITLAGKNQSERATLDLSLTFSNSSKEMSFPQLVVAEVKQEKSNVFSPMIQAFKRRHFVQAGFSKYSTGIALLEPVKNNAFKPIFLKLNKLIHGTK